MKTSTTTTQTNTSWWGEELPLPSCDSASNLGAFYDDQADVWLDELSLNELSLNDEAPPEKDSIFTNSGNHFVFDDLMNGGATPCTEEPTPERQDSPPPPAGDRPEIKSFIDSFHHEGRTTPSAVLNLHNMLDAFPELVYLVRLENGDIEVHFLRDKLIKALRSEEDKFPSLVFTSFERGLKHAGMEVTQSTHGQTQVKKWGMKKGFVPKASSAKKPRKRNTGDEDYVDSKKKQRRSDKLKLVQRPYVVDSRKKTKL